MQVTLAPSIQMKIEDEGGAFESVSSGITFFLIPLVTKKKIRTLGCGLFDFGRRFQTDDNGVLRPLLFGDGFRLRRTKNVAVISRELSENSTFFFFIPFGEFFFFVFFYSGFYIVSV